MRGLPFPQPWAPSNSAVPEPLPNFGWLSESCGGKAAIGVFGGGVMGLLMGVFSKYLNKETCRSTYLVA